MGTTSTRLRRHALLLSLLLTACGDDDSPAKTTPPDATTPVEAGAGGDGGTDSGLDASLNDAGQDSAMPRDAGSDSSAADSSAPDSSFGGDAATELAAALDTNGVRTDLRRAELILPEFCRNAVRCEEPDSGTARVQECVSDSLESFMGSMRDGASATCLDAVLDYGSCVSFLSCDGDNSPCEPFFQLRESNCPAEVD